MAVAQYLRPGSLMEAVKSYLTPDFVRSASSMVGESESATRQTMNGAVPTILGGLTNMVSSREGASNFGGLLHDSSFGSLVENPSAVFSGGSTTQSTLNSGRSLLGKLFGSSSSSVSDALARHGGVSATSATSILGLMAPLTMGILGKRATAQGLDSSGMAQTLLHEKADIAASVPSSVSQLLGGRPKIVTGETPRYSPAEARDFQGTQAAERAYGEREAPRQRRWLPLVLVSLAVLALLWLLMHRRTPNVNNTAAQTAAAMSSISLPGGVNLSVPAGSINYNLAHFLGDNSAQVPKTFVFDHLNFQSASTQLTPDSNKTVSDLAQVLKAYPNAEVQLAGHTDNTGSATANQTLSMQRADAVKTMLVSAGVADNRITTQGFGQDRPIASNDNETGRAQNRRIELTVTRK